MRLDEIEMVCRKSDYYRALPALSQSLTLVLMRSNLSFDDDNRDHVLKTLLHVAMKRHHKELFQECIIFIAGK